MVLFIAVALILISHLNHIHVNCIMSLQRFMNICKIQKITICYDLRKSLVEAFLWSRLNTCWFIQTLLPNTEYGAIFKGWMIKLSLPNLIVQLSFGVSIFCIQPFLFVYNMSIQCIIQNSIWHKNKLANVQVANAK